MNTQLSVGDKAPDFNLPTFSQAHGEGNISLQELKDSIFILAFYPRDNTPGCTKEMCAFRDDYSQFEELGVRVFGVSNDSLTSHQTFSNKFDFKNLTLISAKNSTLLDDYNCNGLILKKRTLYIIDKQGNIAHIHEGMPNNQELITVIKNKINS